MNQSPKQQIAKRQSNYQNSYSSNAKQSEHSVNKDSKKKDDKSEIAKKTNMDVSRTKDNEELKKKNIIDEVKKETIDTVQKSKQKMPRQTVNLEKYKIRKTIRVDSVDKAKQEDKKMSLQLGIMSVREFGKSKEKSKSGQKEEDSQKKVDFSQIDSKRQNQAVKKKMSTIKEMMETGSSRKTIKNLLGGNNSSNLLANIVNTSTKKTAGQKKEAEQKPQITDTISMLINQASGQKKNQFQKNSKQRNKKQQNNDQLQNKKGDNSDQKQVNPQIQKTQGFAKRLTAKLKSKQKPQEEEFVNQYNKVQLDYRRNPAQRVTSLFLKFFLKKKFLTYKLLYIRYLIIKGDDDKFQILKEVIQDDHDSKFIIEDKDQLSQSEYENQSSEEYSSQQDNESDMSSQNSMSLVINNISYLLKLMFLQSKKDPTKYQFKYIFYQMINNKCDFNIPTVGFIEIPQRIMKFLIIQREMPRFITVNMKGLECQIYDKIEDKISVITDKLQKMKYDIQRNFSAVLMLRLLRRKNQKIKYFKNIKLIRVYAKYALEKVQIRVRNKFIIYVKQLFLAQIWNVKMVYESKQNFIWYLDNLFKKNVREWKKYSLTHILICKQTRCFLQNFEKTLQVIKQKNLIDRFNTRMKKIYNFENLVEIKQSTIIYKEKPYIIRYCYDERISRIYVIGNSKSIQHSMFSVKSNSTKEEIIDVIEREYSNITIQSVIYENLEGKIKQELKINLYSVEINERVSKFQMKFIETWYTHWKSIYISEQKKNYDIFYRILNQGSYERCINSGKNQLVQQEHRQQMVKNNKVGVIQKLKHKVMGMCRDTQYNTPEYYYLMLMFREQETHKRRIQFLSTDETRYIIMNQFLKCNESMYIYDNLKFHYHQKYLYYYSQPVPKEYEIKSMNMYYLNDDSLFKLRVIYRTEKEDFLIVLNYKNYKVYSADMSMNINRIWSQVKRLINNILNQIVLFEFDDKYILCNNTYKNQKVRNINFNTLEYKSIGKVGKQQRNLYIMIIEEQDNLFLVLIQKINCFTKSFLKYRFMTVVIETRLNIINSLKQLKPENLYLSQNYHVTVDREFFKQHGIYQFVKEQIESFDQIINQDKYDDSLSFYNLFISQKKDDRQFKNEDPVDNGYLIKEIRKRNNIVSSHECKKQKDIILKKIQVEEEKANKFREIDRQQDVLNKLNIFQKNFRQKISVKKVGLPAMIRVLVRILVFKNKMKKKIGHRTFVELVLNMQKFQFYHNIVSKLQRFIRKKLIKKYKNSYQLQKRLYDAFWNYIRIFKVQIYKNITQTYTSEVLYKQAIMNYSKVQKRYVFKEQHKQRYSSLKTHLKRTMVAKIFKLEQDLQV